MILDAVVPALAWPLQPTRADAATPPRPLPSSGQALLLWPARTPSAVRKLSQTGTISVPGWHTPKKSPDHLTPRAIHELSTLSLCSLHPLSTLSLRSLHALSTLSPRSLHALSTSYLQHFQRAARASPRGLDRVAAHSCFIPLASFFSPRHRFFIGRRPVGHCTELKIIVHGLKTLQTGPPIVLCNR
jgi:hypothetical protein